MRSHYLVGLLSLAVVSCSSVSQKVHDNLISELKARKSPRTPASDLQANLTDLNRLSPGKFEIYVFPKISNKHIKTSEPQELLIGKPQTFEVSTLALTACREFIVNNQFAKYSPKTAFPESLAQENRKCAIIEFTSKHLREIGRGDLRKDDLLKVRLFVDDNYKVHATDYEFYENPRSQLISRIRSNDEQVYSGLNLYPIEMPNSKSLAQATNMERLVEQRLDRVSIFQIKKRLNRNFELPRCKAIAFDQKNSLGEKSRVGWCERMPWPSYLENSRYISIIQPVSVR